MFIFYRDNGVLYTETKFDLIRPITINGKKFEKSEKTTFEDVELIRRLLLVNANVLIRKEPNADFEKPNLYDFSMALEEKSYDIIDGLPDTGKSELEQSEINEPQEENNTDVIEEDDETKSSNQNNHQGKNRKKRNNNSQQEDGDK